MNKVNLENSNYNRKHDLRDLINAFDSATNKFESAAKSVNDDVTRLDSEIERKRLNIEKLEDVERKLNIKEEELDRLKDSTQTSIQELENRKKNVDYEDSDLQKMEIEDIESLIAIKKNKISKIEAKIVTNKEKIKTNVGNLSASRRDLDKLLEEKEISEDSLLRTNDLLDVIHDFSEDFAQRLQSIVDKKYEIGHPEEDKPKKEDKEEPKKEEEKKEEPSEEKTEEAKDEKEESDKIAITPNDDFEPISLAMPEEEAPEEKEEPKDDDKEEALEEEDKEEKDEEEKPQDEIKEVEDAIEEADNIELDIDSDIKDNLNIEEDEEEKKDDALIKPSEEEEDQNNDKMDVVTEEPSKEVEHIELKPEEKLPDETPEQDKAEGEEDAKPWDVKPIGENKDEKVSFLKGTFDKEDISFDDFIDQDKEMMEKDSDRVAKNLMILKKHNIPLSYTKTQANIYYDISPQDLEDLLNIITETQEKNGMDFDIEYTYNILKELGKTDVDKLIDVYNSEFMNINSKSGIIGLLKKTDPNIGDFSENRKANEKTLSQLGIRNIQDISDGYPDFINLDHPLFESIIDLFDKDDLIEKLNTDISVIPQILDYWKNN